MQITLDHQPIAEIDTDVLVLIDFEGRPHEATALQEFRDAGEVN
jgi:hypothetical protein